MEDYAKQHAADFYNDDVQPTIADLNGEDALAKSAKKLWLAQKPAKFNPNTIKTAFYDVLEKDRFSYKQLLTLENLQFLERFLWPNFSKDASYYHVICIALMVNVKRREKVPIWDVFTSSPENFSILFHEILSMCLDRSQSWLVRTQLLGFVIGAFESLDNALVRKECAQLVSIATWKHLSSDAARESQFEKHPKTKKAWRAAAKRFSSMDADGMKKLEFDRDWIHSMVLDILHSMYSYDSKKEAEECVIYCEHFVELLTDLESQLPTRRYSNHLLKDLHLLTAVKLSPMYTAEKNTNLRDLVELLGHFMYFSVDDHTGAQLSREDERQLHCAVIARLQRVALRFFKNKLTILALANYGLLGQREELLSHLSALSDDELLSLCNHLNLRVSYPADAGIKVDRKFVLEVLLAVHEKNKTYQDDISDLEILPNENSIFKSSLHQDERYDATRPLPAPKHNLQYLTTGDFLWRSFMLYRSEKFFGIRRDIEEALKRMQPKLLYPKMETQFGGLSHMGLVTTKPSILEVVPPKVGEIHPAAVRAELNVSLINQPERSRREWGNLGPGDIVFLLAVKGVDELNISNGDLDLVGKFGIKYLRAAEISQVLDQDGRALNSAARLADLEQQEETQASRNRRKLHIMIDPRMYYADQESLKNGGPDIYDSINVIIRRRGNENNFRAILESIKDLAQNEVALPTWLNEVFLGYGDPDGASYKALKAGPSKLDYRDTFLDWEHLVESFPEKKIQPAAGEKLDPPYLLSGITDAVEPAPQPTKKRRRGGDQMAIDSTGGAIVAESYKIPNMGPYPIDKLKQNSIRFTPAQVEAITAGTNPGLTVIVGPPGTGKTDVVAQIISNIYHNFPKQRTLVIAHSNQALNQLFQKIAAVDVDERHLLRLGHGEDQLSTKASYSRQGRVESFMENRARLLAEVDKMAACLNAPGAHGDSCETAGYFDLVYIQPAWAKYEQAVSENKSAQTITQMFPFSSYFSDTPQPLFPQNASVEELDDIIQGCYRHIRKIFSQLQDIRPFELLRTARDRQNYLLANEARIVAMTSTHAAMRKRDIALAGFRYDNVIMEEAAQITEIETFIPLALQETNNSRPLQRVVLVGDHFQNSPVIQNLALKQYSSLDQSMFARLIRLGVPCATLNKQGRARSEIASLYSWRYDNLGSLDIVNQRPEFQLANAGFRHEFQFIDVGDYKGQGEQHPSAYFIQNLGEAEYAVAIYQYMRLLGYPASKITILTTYTGQKALIKDVLDARCAKNPLFGMPAALNTVDKYQGEQNDYVILSLVRTNRIGYLRDIRRMTVALSRARLGLYVLGRKSVIESCFELTEFLTRLTAGKPDKLELVTGELWPSQRRAADLSGLQPATMEGVEHIGRYVYEMAQTKLESLKEERRRLQSGK